ncbi:MAG: hypothetical protein A2909_02670 [Candidatus Tagabacteria bacterium RIFCSPLOWO2_01_FULL_39_11]|uniref:Uncharacterized protein n=1 Tax=Candidatus Tagabacteria bacterium RIFCSPLOWO2_01_FULL_39_11 TaxID=1802295 RepID=A0A1G2LTA2_9BACT|nr:MAG: hypothetical protein A2909_02670 [Candidatus Tagabacteria bacterium RIFCSPLOWO2_01_FULL_39_11]
MLEENNNITYFAETNFRNERRRFGIKKEDRRKHMYIVGRTGTGKTTLLENMAIQDIQNGNGVGIVDPHGDFAEKMLDFVPEHRIKDVVYFNPSDTNWPIGFNVMENVNAEQRHLVATGLLGIFKKIWPDVWSARMEYLLSNAIFALLEYPDATLLAVNRMFSDKDFRNDVVSKITDDVVKAFWEQEFAKYTDRFMQEATPAIQNKVGQFISNPLIRNIIGQTKSAFNIRQIMDEKKIFIINLSKGKIGEENSNLIGAMLITKIYLAAMGRVDLPDEEERTDFYLYVDEFQNFATDAFASILSEARKYRLNLVIAHQYIGQLITDLSTKVRDAVFGNVGSLVTFRVGAGDAEFLEKEFTPEFNIQDLVNLAVAEVYLRLMIDGVPSSPFSAITLSPTKKPIESFREKIIQYSREQYATKKEEVAEKISLWHVPLEKKEKKENEKTDFIEKDSARQPLYKARCKICDKLTYVPFEPEEGRSVYCKEHRESAAAKKPAREFFAPPKQVRQDTASRYPASSLRDGGFVQRPQVSQNNPPISLNELKDKIVPERRGFRRITPDLNELRKTLEESLADDKQETDEKSEDNKNNVNQSNNNSKKGILNPGENIKFG